MSAEEAVAVMDDAEALVEAWLQRRTRLRPDRRPARDIAARQAPAPAH